MAFKTGEKYRCPDPECGCEIQVTKGATKSRVAAAAKKWRK